MTAVLAPTLIPSNPEDDQILERLKRGLEILHDPLKWGKGWPLPGNNLASGKFCMTSAIGSWIVPVEVREESFWYLHRAIWGNQSRLRYLPLQIRQKIAFWNDDPARTHPEVVAMYEKAIDLRRKDIAVRSPRTRPPRSSTSRSMVRNRERNSRRPSPRLT